jgi:hypothetical protein
MNKSNMMGNNMINCRRASVEEAKAKCVEEMETLTLILGNPQQNSTSRKDSSWLRLKLKLCAKTASLVSLVLILFVATKGEGLLFLYDRSSPPNTTPISSAISSKEELKVHSLMKMCVGEEVAPIPSRFQNVYSKIPPEMGRAVGCGIDYFRSESEWIEKQQETSCSPTVDVYAWLVDKVNCFGEGYSLITAYGELIHLLRDKALLHPNGTYIDDDFDTWITRPTLQMILNLEPYLWSNFGWSIRLFYSCDKSVVFAQLMPVCGHKYQKQMSKVNAQYPAIELYILQKVYRNGEGWRLRDNWGGNSFPLSWLVPARNYQYGTMNLQIPAQSEKILDCLYGNWHVFSKGHSRISLECKNRIKAGRH